MGRVPHIMVLRERKKKCLNIVINEDGNKGKKQKNKKSPQENEKPPTNHIREKWKIESVHALQIISTAN